MLTRNQNRDKRLPSEYISIRPSVIPTNPSMRTTRKRGTAVRGPMPAQSVDINASGNKPASNTKPKNGTHSVAANNGPSPGFTCRSRAMCESRLCIYNADTERRTAPPAVAARAIRSTSGGRVSRMNCVAISPPRSNVVPRKELGTQPEFQNGIRCGVSGDWSRDSPYSESETRRKAELLAQSAPAPTRHDGNQS